MPDDCLFCQMSAGEVAIEPLYEDASIFAIQDIASRAPVHLLVISRQHIASAKELGVANAMLIAQMVRTANGLAGEQGLAESGYRLTFNVGPDGGQSIPHL